MILLIIIFDSKLFCNSKTMKKLINLLCLFSILLFSLQLNSQIEYPEDKVSWKFSVDQDGEDATIIAQITMVKHCIYMLLIFLMVPLLFYDYYFTIIKKLFN